MLIVCNGAIKSGSTWLYNILTRLIDCQHPPEKYLTNRSEKSPCIRPELLSDFIESEDITLHNYISKNHLKGSQHRALLEKNANVFVFDIERDPRDVVVSNYYHDCFRNGYKGSFEKYYWENGRFVAAELADYHRQWDGDCDRFYLSSYERLHQEYEAEVRRIATVLRLDPAAVDVERIHSETTMGKLRKDYQKDARYQGEKFFRKGVVGDWKNHFDARMLRDIRRIEQQGLPAWDVRKIRRQIGKELRWRFGK